MNQLVYMIAEVNHLSYESAVESYEIMVEEVNSGKEPEDVLREEGIPVEYLKYLLPYD